MSDEKAVRHILAGIYDKTGRIDFLYNNAGLITSEDKSVRETDDEVVDRIWSANFRTAWLGCKHCLPCMLKNDPFSGSVVNCSSFLAGMAQQLGRWRITQPKQQ